MHTRRDANCGNTCFPRKLPTTARKLAFVAFFDVCDASCPNDRLKDFERCFKVEEKGTWRRQTPCCNFSPAKSIQIKLGEFHLGKEKPVFY